MPSPPPDAPLRDTLERTRRFVRDFTDGVDRRGIRQLFDADATQAFRALTDERRTEVRGTGLRQGITDVRDFFLGVAFKLSPPRRLLFAASLLCPILGIFDLDIALGRYHLFVDAAPFWFLTGFAGLILLLALELVDRLRVRDELEVARVLQRDLLPRGTPEVPGWRLAHSYWTANEIGGDYYGFHALPDGRLALAVGDASGHGIGAGLLMAIANATYEAALDVDPRPSAVLAAMHRTLSKTGGPRAFMSCFVAVLDPATGCLDYADAGHPFPLVRRASGAIEELGEGALPLGLGPARDFDEASTTLLPGDRLVLYSDGIPEAIGASGDFGFDAVRAMIAEPGAAQSIHDRLLDAVRRHLGDEPLRDDVTLVVIDRVAPLPG